MATRRTNKAPAPRSKPGSAPRPAPGRRKPPARKPAAIKVTPLPSDVETDGKVRLNRFLASAGVSSRRAADDLIAGGRVTVNGQTVTELGVRVDPEQDEIVFDGERISEEKKVYVLFNKPKGVVCTNAKNEQRERAIDYLDGVKGRVYTIGRLDADSEGLILLTNDGDFAQEMAHPRYGVPKIYAVLVRGQVRGEDVQKVRGGVWLSEGKTSGASVKIERRGREKTYLKITLREGKNREIRRVFAKLGMPVLTLKRVRIGGLNLHGLRSGNYRFLKPQEIAQLRVTAREGEA